jgi:hypothetical protein
MVTKTGARLAKSNAFLRYPLLYTLRYTGRCFYFTGSKVSTAAVTPESPSLLAWLPITSKSMALESKVVSSLESIQSLFEKPLPCFPWSAGNTSGHRLVVSTPEQAAHLLKAASDSHIPVALTPEDALFLEQPLWIDASGMTTIPEYQIDDLVITTQTGITAADLQARVEAQGHAWPLRYPESLTLAEILASDRPALESGLRRTLKEYVLGMRIATCDGNMTRSGGKVVKNVTGYDLHKFYTGTQFELGIPVEVSLRLYAKPPAEAFWLISCHSLKTLAQWNQTLLADPNPAVSVAEIAHSSVFQTLPPEWLLEESGPWVWMVQGSGSPRLLEALGQELQTLTDNPKLLPMEGSYLATARQVLDPARFEGALQVHLGLPFNGWLSTVEALEATFAKTGEKVCIQIRPAIGLVQLSWRNHPNDVVRETLSAQKQTLEASHQGWVQALNYPLSWIDWAVALNQPDSPIVQRWSREFKALYDPEGVLVSRRLHLWHACQKSRKAEEVAL